MDGINAGQIITVGITVLSMAGIAYGFIWALKANTMVIDTKLAAVQEELKKLSGVVTDMAVQNQRLNMLEERQANLAQRAERLDSRYEELRHGEGFVFPFPHKTT